MNGKFIAIEGLEGAGKSTAHQFVVQLLNELGVNNVIFTREPGGTPLAEKLRALIKHETEEPITDKAELLMLYAARIQLVENVIKPALAQGKWVVGDRHDMSSQAYQGGGRRLDADFMQMNLDFFHRTRERYLELVKDNPKAVLINAEQSIEQVRIDIEHALKNWWKRSEK